MTQPASSSDRSAEKVLFSGSLACRTENQKLVILQLRHEATEDSGEALWTGLGPSHHGERCAVTTSVIPIASNRSLYTEPYELPLWRSRNRGAVSHGNVSVTRRDSHAEVGLRAILKWTTFLRS